MKRIEIKNLSKRYGRKLALNNVSLTFVEGKIYGVLGPNGMGKSTLLKTVVGVIRPTSGKIYFKDDKNEIINRSEILSFSPENYGLYRNMKVTEFLKYISNIVPNWSKEREQNLMNILDIPPKEKIGNLSHGFQARVRVLSALTKECVFYFLDEPFSGIDPTSRYRIKEAIKEHFKHSTSFIITSHLISEIEDLFDYVYFLNRGEIVLEGQADELKKKHNTSIEGIYIKTFR